MNMKLCTSLFRYKFSIVQSAYNSKIYLVSDSHELIENYADFGCSPRGKLGVVDCVIGIMRLGVCVGGICVGRTGWPQCIIRNLCSEVRHDWVSQGVHTSSSTSMIGFTIRRYGKANRNSN